MRILWWEKSFLWGHDHDLYSWIAKDILVGGHMRLVGQITSVDGVFIGSFYYYLMALGYALSGMNPGGAVIITSLLSLAAMWSVWWVFRQTIGKKAGLVALAIYSLSWGIAVYEKWSVPTQPVLLWSIWCWWAIVKVRENSKIGWMVWAILTGFVWQIHIGLLPLLPIGPMVWLLNRNKSLKDKIRELGVKTIILMFCLGVVVNLPFIIFEAKYNFSQVRSMVAATKIDRGGPTGRMKLLKVVDASGREMQQRFLNGFDRKSGVYSWIVILTLITILIITKRWDNQKGMVLLLWVLMLTAAQFVSKRVVSEYYFTSMIIVILWLIVSAITTIPNRILIVIVMVFGLLNIKWMMDKHDVSDSLYYRNMVVDYIKKDMIKNGYSCMAVNHIATPGNGVGWRYLLWQNGILEVKPQGDRFSIYDIVNPWLITDGKNDARFGRFGVILPKRLDKYQWEKCGAPEFQPDPLLGYTE